MKRIIILLIAVLISANVEARRGQGRDAPATIHFHDGTQVEGFLRPFAVASQRVELRAERGGRAERFESRDIASIRFFDDEEDAYAILVFRPWIRAVGATRQQSAHWVNVLITGPVTLYRFTVTQRQGGATFITDSYLARRENEDVLTLITMVNRGATVFGRSHLVALGWQYFESYPELAERIQNREFNNTSADIRAIIHEYNFRAGQR